jgi:DNA-binding NarL/FixJ family response regulator
MKPDLPVLVTTGFSGRLDPSALHADGIVGVLQKPYSAASLAHAVRDAISGSGTA